MMAAYVVEIFGPGFRRITLAPSKEDAQRIKEYWRRRGMDVDINKVVMK